MEGIQVGCGPVTWIKFTPDGARMTAPEEQILTEIAQAGYEGIAAGPKEGRSIKETMALYAQYGLKAAPGYLGANFWEVDQKETILEKAKTLARFTHDVGCTELYVAASGMDYVTGSGQTRRAVAGHVSPEDSLSTAEYQRFADLLNRVGEATLEIGVKSCFHNHVGTVIETREEVDRLFSLVDRDVVFLGPDTGHLAWGGADVVEFFRDYADSIKTVHLKDIDRAVMEEGRQKEWPYNTFSDQGVFAELGEGFIDFPAIFDILGKAGFQGWLITETDVTQKPTALESVTISRDYLKGLGI